MKELTVATIEDVRLELVETLGTATGWVTYKLVGSDADVQQQRSYREVVELIGDDIGPGEDGHSEPIAGGRLEAQAVFTTQILNRKRKIMVSTDAIDEDKGFGAGLPLPKEDEIRARVTLTRLVLPSITEQSTKVHRGALFATP